MGLLDNNIVKTIPFTTLDSPDFKMIASNDAFDIWQSQKSGADLKMTFRDAFAWVSSTKLYLVKGSITGTPSELSVDTNNFPGLRQNSNGTWPIIVRVIGCPCHFFIGQERYGNISFVGGDTYRVCVIFNNGQIYHNYPSCYDDHDFYNNKWVDSEQTILVDSLFTKFTESVVWDLPNRKHPVKTTSGADATLIATGAYYYNPALPDRCYEMHPGIGEANGYGNTVGFSATNNVNPASKGTDIGLRSRFWRSDIENVNANSFDYMGGLVTDTLFTMVGTYRINGGTNPCRTCVFGTNDGGRTWYNMYEFGGKPRKKVGATYVNADTMNGVPLAQTGSVSSGIYAFSRRTVVIPSAEDKEPAVLFEYDLDVAISSIIGDDTNIIVTSNGHGLTEGDCIVIKFQSGITADNRVFDWMVNSTADGTTGGNGLLFTVKNVTTDTFELSLFIWNPDNNLTVRHIHAMNRCKDGVTISTGEGYPDGGWIIYDSIHAADYYAGYNVASTEPFINRFIRLNSTNNSFARALGCIIEQEDDKTYCYIASDTESIISPTIPLPEGRTVQIRHNACGVWKIPSEGIDSLEENGLMKFNSAPTSFGLQQMGNAFVYIGQTGLFALSYDRGESWSVAQLPVSGISRFSGLTFDRKFSIENFLVQLKH